jgi:Cu(I)/Ag(I) efflux system membrane fusion protein
MYAEVEIAAGGNEKALTVPESAVIDTGKRQVAIVDKGDGRFEPREVKIGRRGEGFVEIKSGVNENERVVTAANFLIDAESNLKAALRALDQGEAGK